MSRVMVSTFVVFWMGITRSPMGVTRQWWVLTIALLKNRVYVKHHQVFEEHPLTAGSLIIPHQGYIHRYTPCLTVHCLLWGSFLSG